MTGETQRFLVRPDFSLRYTAAEECAFEPHSHNAYVVTAILSGAMSVTIGDEQLKLEAGDLALTAVGQSHSASATGVEFISVAIRPSLVEELAEEVGLISTAAEIVFRAARVSDPGLLAVARAIAVEIERVDVGHGVMVDSLARQLTIHLLRDHLTLRRSAQIEVSRAGPVDRRLRRAIEFMHDNFSRELALEEIASAAYLSEYHFARLFKQIAGVTPHVYLANLRLERARVLLHETTLSISEIATRVGYNSQSHFAKMFKSVTGVTPTAYRDSLRSI